MDIKFSWISDHVERPKRKWEENFHITNYLCSTLTPIYLTADRWIYPELVFC